MAEEPIEDLPIAEFVNGNARDRGARGEALRIGRRFIENYLRDVRRSDDLDAILDTEGAILVNDLQRYVNSRAMRTSLEASLAEHAVATGLLATVRDPKEYRRVDAAHRLPRNRTGGVPRDEARQFFRSHAARLLNLDKSRLDESEKRVLDKRRLNMRHAEKLYAALQERALGIEADRDRGMGLGS